MRALRLPGSRCVDGPPNSISKGGTSGHISKNKRNRNNKIAARKNLLKGVNTWENTKEIKTEEAPEKIVEKKQLFVVNEQGDRVKKFRDGIARPWLDIKYENNERMEWYDGFFVKKQAVAGLDQMKIELQAEGLTKIQVMRKMLKAIRKEKRKLFKELLYEEVEKQQEAGTYTGINKLTKKKLKEQADDTSTMEPQNNVNHMGTVNELHKESAISIAEQRRQQYLKRQEGKDDRSKGNFAGNNKTGSYNDSSSPQFVRFDGYLIKKEAAVRLSKLKEDLQKSGASAEEVAQAIKRERHREESDLKKERNTVCFSCRRAGHVVADCPLKRNTGGVGACYTCGSLEHASKHCTVRRAEGGPQFAYATCFICHKKGHISRECPQSTHGLYPRGGGCTLCDSNQHLIKDCPRNMGELSRRKQIVPLTAERMKMGSSVEAMEATDGPAPILSRQSNYRNIRF